MYALKGQRKDSQLQILSKGSEEGWSRACLRCWLEQTVNTPGSVELSRQPFKGGAGVILGAWPYAA